MSAYITCLCGATMAAFFDSSTKCGNCGRIWHLELCRMARPSKRRRPFNKRRVPADKGR